MRFILLHRHFLLKSFYNHSSSIWKNILRPVYSMSTQTGIEKKTHEKPVIAVIGASGVGKSKLAIDLSLRFEGECINADAMQIYKDLDISTNKVSAEEQSGCPHHLLGIYDLIENSERYTVHNFQKDALSIINNIIHRGRIPILVGGTMYYIESILFDHLVPARSGSSDYKRDELADRDCSELYAELQQVDPQAAHGLHPNDRRKIFRALEVFKSTGRQLSDYYAEQHKAANSSTGEMLSGEPRFRKSILIWLDCDQKVLDTRLNMRVDDMIASGLVKEMDEFLDKLNNRHNVSVAVQAAEKSIHDGVLQSIGLKELLPYLRLNENDRASEHGRKVFHQCIENMKTKTRRYARKQLTWVKNRFLKRRGDRFCPPVFRIDVTEFVQASIDKDTHPEKAKECWQKILSYAHAVTESAVAMETQSEFLKHLELCAGLQPEGNTSQSGDKAKIPDTVIHRQCQYCKGNPVFVRESQWQQHVNGSRHYKALYWSRKRTGDQKMDDSPLAKQASVE